MAPVYEIQGMKFEIFRELAEAWYHSPGELVTFGRLERYSDGEDPRASLRVRIREIKVALGKALGVRFSAGELIINAPGPGVQAPASLALSGSYSACCGCRPGP